jgi:hypothetical protein
VVVFFNGHKIFRDKFDRTIGFECGYGVWRHFQQYFSYIVASIRFEKIFLMVFTIKEKIREKMSKIHWFKQISLQQFTVSRKLQFTAIYCVKKITVYSNLPRQENYCLQQFTVSITLLFIAIYRVKQITV